MENFTKLYSIKTYIRGRLTGDICFPRSNIGRNIELDNGDNAQIFRQVIFKTRNVDDARAVLFHVKFNLISMSPGLNRLFSNLPIPFFVGLPGFCAKVWCINNRNYDFHGFYKWRSREYAEEYSNSFAMRFMARRSVPESLSFEITEYQGNKYNAFPDRC